MARVASVYFRTLLIAVIFALAIAADHVDESHVADQSPPSSSSPQPTETEHSIELHSVESTASSSSNFNPSASQSELSVAVDATGALQDASSTPSESLSVSENSVSEPEVSVPEVPAPVEEGSGVELPSENPPQPQPVEHHSTVEQHQPPEHQSSIEQSADTDHSLVEATEASSIQDSPPPSQTAESSVISSEAPAEHIVPDEQVVPAEQTVPATDATSEPPAPAEPIETDTVDAVQSQSIDAENSGFAMPRVTEQPIEVPTSAVNGDESSQTPIEPQPVEGENASESNPSGNEVSSGELPAEEVSSASSAVDASQNSNATAVAQEMNTILNEAEDALYRGDLAAAAAAYERLIAKHRTPEAHFGLGEMLLYVGDGYSSPNNSSVTDRALLNLKAAAELGDSHAQALLSTLHALGAGVKHDEALAVLYAYFAALGDSASAKLTMAYRHLHGLGVPQVCVTAAAYYQELAQNVIEKLEVESQSVRGGGQATDGAVIERQRLSDAKSRDSGVSDTINRWLNSVLGEEKLDIDAGAVAGEGQAAAHNGRIPGGAAGAYRNLRGGAGGRQVLPAGGEAAGAEAAALPDAALPGGQDEIHDVPEEVAVDDDGHALEANVVMYYRQAALQGDVNAQVAMGQLHYHGFRGVPRDLAKAASYFQMAVDRGDATAHAMLGQMYLQGVGVPQNNETAFNLFTKGAAKKAVAAMNGLGYMYLNGIGTAVNTSQALRWFKSAAENGNADAQFNLGSIYFGGLSGVAVDAGAALRYFALAAQQGHTRSIYNLAQMHLHGMATPKSCAVAVKLLKTVAERGEWASILKEAYTDYQNGFDRKSLILYLQAAEEGFEVAQSNAAWLLERPRAADLFPDEKLRRALALRYWRRSAEQGSSEAQRKSGDYFFNGWAAAAFESNVSQSNALPGGSESEKVAASWTQPDYESAAAAYLAGAEARNGQSAFNVGFMYEHGLGLKRDLHLAKRYYDLALTIEPGALIAIRLSLWHLWLRTRWEESWAPMLHARGWIGAEWLKRPAPSAADWFAGLFGTSSSRGYLHGNQSAVLAQTTTSAAQPDSTPASSLVSTVSTAVLKSLRAASNGFVECWEDLALMVVGAALVIVVAVRARHI